MVSLLFIKKLLLWKLRKENIKEGQTNAKTSNQIFWQFIPFYKFSKWFRSIIVRNQLKSLGHRERIINVSLVERKIRDRDNWFYKILIIFRNLINKRISSINLAGTLTKRTFVAKALLNKKEKNEKSGAKRGWPFKIINLSVVKNSKRPETFYNSWMKLYMYYVIELFLSFEHILRILQTCNI